MTRTTNSRLAGFAFLFYIAAGIAGMVLFGQATSGEGIPARLASLASHPAAMRIAILLSLLNCFSALVLAVTLYALTYAQDRDVAMLASTCRIAEGVIGGVFIAAQLGLLWLATASGENSFDPDATKVLGAFLFKMPAWNTLMGASFFALGSALFSWLMLRGRLVPVVLAWLGVIASVLVLLVIPMQLIGVVAGLVGWLSWLPMLVFEVWLAVWLIVKGADVPATQRSSAA